MNVDIDKFSSTTKNIFYIIILVGQAVLAYSQIYSNQSDIIQEKKDREAAFNIQAQRSDKRYKRATVVGDDHESRLRDLEEFASYIKGKEGY